MKRTFAAMTRSDDNEREKAEQLNAEEGKPHGHERISLHMGYVHQRLAYASDQHDQAQVVDCRPVDVEG